MSEARLYFISRFCSVSHQRNNNSTDICKTQMMTVYNAIFLRSSCRRPMLFVSCVILRALGHERWWWDAESRGQRCSLMEGGREVDDFTDDKKPNSWDTIAAFHACVFSPVCFSCNKGAEAFPHDHMPLPRELLIEFILHYLGHVCVVLLLTCYSRYRTIR